MKSRIKPEVAASGSLQIPAIKTRKSSANADPALTTDSAQIIGGLARLEGFEPPTYRFEVCRSIQLSYRRVYRILFESISYGAEFAMRDRRGPSQSAPMAA